MPDTRRPIIAIDLLRFVCALLVIAYHFGSKFAEPDPRAAIALAGVPLAALRHPLADAGRIGVDLFFVISGMVIARSALDTRWTAFLRHRALRLVPGAWLCATTTFAVISMTGGGDAALAGDWWRSMCFWPIGAQIDGPYWTLGVEMSFYLAIATAAGGDVRRITRIGYAIGAASTLFWAACLAGALGETAMTSQTVILLLLPHGCLFALGMAIALPPGRGDAPVRAIAVTVLLAAVAVEASAHVGGWRATPAGALALSLLAAGIASLFAADRLQARLERWIAPATARAVGLMTYPLYLLHFEIGAVILGRLYRAGMPLALAVALDWAALIALAWTVSRHAEPALRRLLARAFSPARVPVRDRRPSASPPAG